VAHVDANPHPHTHTQLHPAPANGKGNQASRAGSRRNPPAPGSSHGHTHQAGTSDTRHPDPNTDTTPATADTRVSRYARRHWARSRDAEHPTDQNWNAATLDPSTDTDPVSNGCSQADQDGNENTAAGGDSRRDATPHPANAHAYRHPTKAAADTHADTTPAIAHAHANPVQTNAHANPAQTHAHANPAQYPADTHPATGADADPTGCGHRNTHGSPAGTPNPHADAAVHRGHRFADSGPAGAPNPHRAIASQRREGDSFKLIELAPFCHSGAPE
jgi:hypothetical protein